ncbi:hypothetical protein ABLE68_07210 [Nocardioides sp. CN2-186]|uniref:hypothetical protein n=1 Tax=Nocardioides tweenelious TaxID=3156607 RepID=UPI0032B440EB
MSDAIRKPCPKLEEVVVHHYVTDLPAPLTIALSPTSETVAWPGTDARLCESVVQATSPEFPGHLGASAALEEAVWELIESILDSQPLATELVDALIDAGYDQDVVDAWSREMRGPALRRLRSDADEALETLHAYSVAGVPALAASTYFALALDPGVASRIHATGRTLQETSEYVHMLDRDWLTPSEFMSWLLSDVPVERAGIYVNRIPLEDALAWEEVVTELNISDSELATLFRHRISRASVRSGLPIQRLATYAECRVRDDETTRWETVATRYGISDEDLRDVLLAGFSPSDVEECLAESTDSGSTVGDAARTLLALRGVPKGDPWASPAYQLPLF